jgi:hypothetical protein
MDEKPTQSIPPETTSKKVYATPTLTNYGSVAKLVQSLTASVRSDSANNHMHA